MVGWPKPKCEVAVIRMNHLADLPVRVIAGCELADLHYTALPPYAPVAVEFLAEWSKRLLARSDIRSYPDVASFAFWCRSANLARLRRELDREKLRVGRGMALPVPRG